MFGTTLPVLATVALALSGEVAAKNHHLSRRAPKGWAYGYLEDYHTYHIRYLAVGCQFQHGKQFFDDCCHPMLSVETLERNRPAHCVPGAQALASASRVEPTFNPSSIAPPPDASAKIAAVKTSAAASVITSAPVADEDLEECDEEDDDPAGDYDDGEDCEEDGSSAGPAPTPAPATSAPPVTGPAAPAAPASSAASSSSKEASAPKPTSEAPAPSLSAKPTETPASSSPKPVESAAPSPSPEPVEAPSSGNDETGGFATFYTQNGVAGACGDFHGDYDLIVAMDYRRYGDTGRKSDLCGKMVQITNPKNGKSVTAKVADACPSCANGNSIDLSKGAFFAIATEEEGMVAITWRFV